jgi:hypothetical protein
MGLKECVDFSYPKLRRVALLVSAFVRPMYLRGPGALERRLASQLKKFPVVLEAQRLLPPDVGSFQGIRRSPKPCVRFSPLTMQISSPSPTLVLENQADTYLYGL